MTSRPQPLTVPAPSLARVTKQPAGHRPADLDTSVFLADMIAGLSKSPKQTSPKYFYDARGSALFEQIMELPEYYPTRTEMGILSAHAEDLADFCGPNCLLVEPGAGNLAKVRLFLKNLRSPAGFIPLDVSGIHLSQAAHGLRLEQPALKVLPVCADFTAGFSLPQVPSDRKVVFFPGSTLGNFEPHEANRLLASFAQVAGKDGGIILGVDLRKHPSILVPAYDDAQGVTAAFNKNLLFRMREELGAELDPDRFSHRALYNEELGRVEMHLVSTVRQTIQLGRHIFQLEAGETIHTENSYKQDLAELVARCESFGLRAERILTDSRQWFAVLCLSVDQTA